MEIKILGSVFCFSGDYQIPDWELHFVQFHKTACQKTLMIKEKLHLAKKGYQLNQRLDLKPLV